MELRRCPIALLKPDPSSFLVSPRLGSSCRRCAICTPWATCTGTSSPKMSSESRASLGLGELHQKVHPSTVQHLRLKLADFGCRCRSTSTCADMARASACCTCCCTLLFCRGEVRNKEAKGQLPSAQTLYQKECGGERGRCGSGALSKGLQFHGSAGIRVWLWGFFNERATAPQVGRGSRVAAGGGGGLCREKWCLGVERALSFYRWCSGGRRWGRGVRGGFCMGGGGGRGLCSKHLGRSRVVPGPFQRPPIPQVGRDSCVVAELFQSKRYHSTKDKGRITYFTCGSEALAKGFPFTALKA